MINFNSKYFHNYLNYSAVCLTINFFISSFLMFLCNGYGYVFFYMYKNEYLSACLSFISSYIVQPIAIKLKNYEM